MLAGGESTALDGSKITSSRRERPPSKSTMACFARSIRLAPVESRAAMLRLSSMANTTTASTQYYASVGSLDDGGFVIVWSGYDGSDYEIYGQRFDANGNRRSSKK